MKAHIPVTALNGLSTNVFINIDIGNLRIDKTASSSFNGFQSELLCSEVNSITKNFLSEFIPNIKNKFISLSVISPELDKLALINAKPDIHTLALIIASIIIGQLSGKNSISFEGFNAHTNKSDKNLIKSNISKFIVSTDKRKNLKLEETEILISKRNYAKAYELLSVIKKQNLSFIDSERFSLYQFIAELRTKKLPPKDAENLYRSFQSQHSDNKSLVLDALFALIKYFEDIREPKKPKEYLSLLEKEFSISSLSEKNKTEYHYLKGRELYSRGFYWEALNSLQNAFVYFDKTDDPENIAKVFNTAANCYLDNYLLEKGKILAEKALNIREQENSPLLGDSYSLYANYFYKTNDFKTAVFYYTKAISELKKYLNDNQLSRNYNYLLKAYIAGNDLKNARIILDLLTSFETDLNYKEKSYLYFYSLLYYYKTKDDDNFSVALNKLISLGTAADSFPAAWTYTFKAIKEFEEKKYTEGCKTLNIAINTFSKDNYFLEAFYVWIYKQIYKPASFKGDNSFGERSDIFENFFNKHLEVINNLKDSYFTEIFKEYSFNDENILSTFAADVLKITNITKSSKTMAKQLSQLINNFILF